MNLIDSINKLISLSQNGKAFSQDEINKKRFEEIQNISMEILDDTSNLNLSEITNIYKSDTLPYKTPKVEVRALINDNNNFLFVKEKQDSLWSLPGGWADVGFSPSESIIKEVKEETGLDIFPLKLLSIFDKRFYNHPPSTNYVYKICFLCKIIGGNISINKIETIDVKYFTLKDIPELSTRRITREQLDILIDVFVNKKDTYFN